MKKLTAILITIVLLCLPLNIFAEMQPADENIIKALTFGAELRYTLVDNFCWFDEGVE